MTMVKVWFKLTNTVEEEYGETVEKAIEEALKNIETVCEVKLLEPIYNRDVGYFKPTIDTPPIGFVEVHISHRQEVADALVEKLSATPLFIW